MYNPRKTTFERLIESEGWSFKLYSIVYENLTIDWEKYDEGIAQHLQNICSGLYEGRTTHCGFIIAHEGQGMSYLVVCWWGNDNELFVDVLVHVDGQWMSSDQYSFCLYDMEVLWFERNTYVQTMYSGHIDPQRYLDLTYDCRL